jgi:predicted  nucleic acid-binding Zn-ribbon protein
MMEDLTGKRAEAAKGVSQEYLAAFDRIAGNYEGDAMAAIEIHGKRPPQEFVCGGCFMALNAEHVNALRTRDEIRTCDNCGRILYLEVEAQKSATT